MFGLPTIAIVLLAGAILAVLTVGGFSAYRRHQVRFCRVFGVDPKSGSEESVKGIIRQVLRRMVWELETLSGLLEYYNQRATTAVDTDSAISVHDSADHTRQEILKGNEALSHAVVLAGHFDHRAVVQELNLQQYLPKQGH